MIILLLCLLLLILISGFFAASEIGMMSLNRYRLRYLVKKNNKQAVRVNALLLRPDKLLSVILIGNTIANIVASTVATLIGQQLYGTVGVAIATLILTLIILIFSEMTPKTFAAMYPEQVAFKASLPLQYLHTILLPLVQIISFITQGLLCLLGVPKHTHRCDTLSAEEIRCVVNEADSLLPIEHKSMLISLLDLEKATVEDILIPTADIVGIDLERPWQEIIDQLETAQHTRLPLYRHSIDHLVGMIHVRKVLNLALEERLNKETLSEIAESPYFIPEATPLHTQLLNFQKIKKRSCFVVNEYGDLQGLVTLEDILEEVVGEFTTDIAALSKDILPEENGYFIIDASIMLRNLKRLLDWPLPDLGPRTLSGLIIEYLGYIPPANCCLTINNYQIEILKVGDNMVKNVRMRKI